MVVTLVSASGVQELEPVWWPGLSTAIEDMVKRCTTCAKERPEAKEPLMLSSFPSCPWE